MFYPQEHRAQEQEEQQANSDPREQYTEYQTPPEQDYAGDASYERGYSGYTAYTGGEKLRPRVDTRQKQWLWIIAIVMVILISGGWFFNSFSGFIFTLIGIAIIAYVLWRVSFNQKVELPPQSFVVNGRADLILDNTFGAIHIHRGPVNAVEVRATRRYSSLLSFRPSYPLNITQRENEISINSQIRSSFLTFSPLALTIERVDLDIITPEESDVRIHTEAGSVAIDGIHGQASIQTNAGTIDVKNAFLLGNSSAHTNAGTINMQDVRLEGGARVDTNAGTIAFRGSLQTGNHYFFETNAGTIDMALPPSAAFSLDARTSLGTITNRFGVIAAGDGPQAILHLRSNLGTITVRPM
jgi:hypothetical protein